jgi:hypothetical protein
MSKHITLRRPPASATREEIDNYHREVAAALTAVGVANGDYFIVAPAEVDVDGPKARTSDPDTAKLAALRNKPKRGSQRAKIVDLLVDEARAAGGVAGFRGITASGIANRLSIPLNSISTRMSECERGGWVAVRGTVFEAGADRSLYIPTEKALQG